jgi:hypothetical protein
VNAVSVVIFRKNNNIRRKVHYTHIAQNMVVTADAIHAALASMGGAVRQYGFYPGSTEPHSFSIEVVSDAVEDLQQLFRPRKTINRNASSYGLKHVLERWRSKHMLSRVGGGYISNGDFIVAMKLVGYNHAEDSGINVHFNYTDVKTRR